jgi:hypothetical protein
MADAIADADPVRPDRRILLAVADVHHLLLHDRGGTVTATARAHAWTITFGPDTVGTLPDLQSFADADSLLAGWARRLATRRPPPAAHSGAPDTADLRWRLTAFTLPRTTAVLMRLDTLWRRSSDDALLPVAATAATQLWLQTVDVAGVGDLVGAHALAIVATARALTGAPLLEERVLTAAQLGYTAEAAQWASALADSDPVRLYTADYPYALFHAASDSAAPARTRYLALLRLESTPSTDEELALVGKAFEAGVDPLLVASASLTGSGMAVHRGGASLAPPLVLASLEQTAGISALTARQFVRQLIPWWLPGHSDIHDVLDRIDQETRTFGPRLTGPFLTADVYRSVLRAHLTTALGARCTYALDELSSAPAAAAWAARVARASPDMGGDVGRVCGDLADAARGAHNLTALTADLAPTVAIGRSMRTSVDDAIDRQGSQRRNAKSARAADSLRATLDSRPEDLNEVAFLMHARDVDLVRVQRVYEREAELLTRGGSREDVQLLSFLGDDAGLLHLADDTTKNAFMREVAFQYAVADSAVPVADAVARYDTFLRIDSATDSLAESAAHYLASHGNRPAGIAVLQRWLEMESDTAEESLDEAVLRAQLARLQDDAGRPADAWASVAPALRTGQGEAMGAAALALEYLGQDTAADALSAAAVDRYPNIAERVARAEVLWDQRRYSEAAVVLVDSAAATATWDWQEQVSLALVHAAPRLGSAGVRQAGAALMASGIDPSQIVSVARHAARRGRADVAVILDELPSDHPRQVIEPLIAQASAYLYLTETSGHDSAARWIRAQGWDAIDWPRLAAAYNERAFGVLWDLPPAADVGSSFWLLRAAAELQSPPSRTHWAALQAYYRAVPPGAPDPYFIMGRYLVGLADASELFALVDGADAHRRCEIAYYLAVRAEHEGRWTDALEWYRVVVATGSRRDGEYEWASARLGGWAAASKSLAVIARSAGIRAL